MQLTADERQILTILKKYVDREVSCLNFYKGLTVNYRGTVYDVNDTAGFATIVLSPVQAVAAMLQKKLILVGLGDRRVQAELKSGPNVRCEVTVTGFSWTEAGEERRETIRVAVSSGATLTVSGGNLASAVTLPLVDLSLGGAKGGPHADIRCGETYNLRISIGSEVIDINGSVAGSDANASRYFFSVTPVLERHLAPLIFHRQGELIRELKDRALAKGLM